MHSSDLGYVPREMGLHGHLLELRWCSLRACITHTYRPFYLKLEYYLSDIHLLGRLYGLARSVKVQVLHADLRCALCDVADGLLHVNRFWSVHCPVG